jgi:2-oxoisovalerate dehydrogenase E2 component (dihydrolipoyl transacylase)
MSNYTFPMPDVGEGTTEAEVVAWFVEVGQAIDSDDPLVEVMTDKASLEITSPVAGTVVQLGPPAGGRVAVGGPLVVLDVDGEMPEPTVGAVGLLGDRSALQPARSPAPPPEPAGRQSVLPIEAPAVSCDSRPLASPSVRRHAHEVGVDLVSVRGSGPAGRIEHDDVARAAEPAVAAKAATGQDEVTDIPVTGLRRQIAERMTRAVSRAPHITLVEEVEVGELNKLREELNAATDESRRLTLLPFISRALARAVRDYPIMNSRFDDDAGIVHQHLAMHVGIAMHTERGLLVPVVRHVGSLSLWECAAEIRRLAAGGRAGTLSRGELTGSTITITSLGSAGGIMNTPILNYPEVAIVGVNKVQMRPVWTGSSFAPRQMMNLSCSFDHRVIDGFNAAGFLGAIKNLLEHPAMLFVERP